MYKKMLQKYSLNNNVKHLKQINYVTLCFVQLTTKNICFA